IFDVLASELLYATIGVAGVGLFVRRRGWKLLDRLGLQMPTWEQLRQSLRWVLLLLGLQWLAGAILFLTNPDQAEALNNLNTLLLKNIDTAGEWFLLSIAAAFGEEILFRGALQPVLGLWATALLFALAHTQYGFTLATVLVFAIGAVLGLIRRRYNTGVSIFVHFSYNFILGLLSLLAPLLEQMARY
ncbi:MAG TPA: type II CAAX endopeptidase family protein, partial [Candidatus Binatia bacterium]|nr:type II CAAX endopeptidase family protein [Candidatus Binatia bacterium]